MVVFDALVSEPILGLINPQAERVHAGKRRGRHSMSQVDITQLLHEKALEHAVIVRLKGGRSVCVLAAAARKWVT